MEVTFFVVLLQGIFWQKKIKDLFILNMIFIMFSSVGGAYICFHEKLCNPFCSNAHAVEAALAHCGVCYEL